jgi:Zn-dependent peptidase ImmA (M78 family)
MPDSLSGILIYVNSAPIVVVRQEDSHHRRRFWAAHELGHVLMAHHDSLHVDRSRPEGYPPEYSWRQERAATDFAAALLMPAESLRRDASAASLTLGPVAEIYAVSQQALATRLSALGLRPAFIGD